MYKILRLNKRFNNKTFSTYEQARQYLRKWVRKNLTAIEYPSSNANISDFGFSVVKL